MKNGDVVQLRSGGPKMTIRAVHCGGRLVEVIWMDTHGRLQEARLVPALLVER